MAGEEGGGGRRMKKRGGQEGGLGGIAFSDGFLSSEKSYMRRAQETMQQASRWFRVTTVTCVLSTTIMIPA